MQGILPHTQARQKCSLFTQEGHTEDTISSLFTQVWRRPCSCTLTPVKTERDWHIGRSRLHPVKKVSAGKIPANTKELLCTLGRQET